jgi:hypothetical protein
MLVVYMYVRNGRKIESTAVSSIQRPATCLENELF